MTIIICKQYNCLHKKSKTVNRETIRTNKNNLAKWQNTRATYKKQ